MFHLFRHFCEELPEGNTVFGDSRIASPKVLVWAKEENGLWMILKISGISKSKNINVSLRQS